MKISFAIATHNEGAYVDNLLNHLVRFIKLSPSSEHSFEIVVVDDNSTGTTADILDAYHTAHSDIIQVHHHLLNSDFASHKNYLNEKCTGDWILQLDADELVSHDLLSWLPNIIESNPRVDAYWLPRVNTVDGLTLDHVRKWGWVLRTFDDRMTVKLIPKDSAEYDLLKQYNFIIEEQESGYVVFYTPIIQWPDMQMRLYRRAPSIKWERPVHEQLVGYENFTHLPMDTQYAIEHHKKIDRQEKQNAFYETLL